MEREETSSKREEEMGGEREKESEANSFAVAFVTWNGKRKKERENSIYVDKRGFDEIWAVRAYVMERRRRRRRKRMMCFSLQLIKQEQASDDGWTNND